MGQNWAITVCNNSHSVFVHTHLGAKEPRKSFSLNSGRLQADRETSPCCQRSQTDWEWRRNMWCPPQHYTSWRWVNCGWNLLFSYICKDRGALASSVPSTDPHRCWSLIFQLFLLFFFPFVFQTFPCWCFPSWIPLMIAVSPVLPLYLSFKSHVALS